MVVKVVNLALTAFGPACGVDFNGAFAAVVVNGPTTFRMEATAVAVVVGVAFATLGTVVVIKAEMVSVYLSLER